METTGRLVSVTRDIISGKLNITFQIDTTPIDTINGLAKLESLDIKAERHRKKRSLDANSYFHVLVGKIADKLTISKARAKNMLICRYGQVQFLPDGQVMVYKTNAPADYMLELETLHCLPIKYGEENGKEVTFYKIYRGSHTYDTEEMSALIEGTVADAKELGIETLPPAELERMYRAWANRKAS